MAERFAMKGSQVFSAKSLKGLLGNAFKDFRPYFRTTLIFPLSSSKSSIAHPCNSPQHATDGGYYLIGMQRLRPELFRGIAWSAAEVLQQTVKDSKKLGLTLSYLLDLTDIDTPKDLSIWEQVKAAAGNDSFLFC
jgi:Uncharacterized protein conserved in bacteria (DUF2064)